MKVRLYKNFEKQYTKLPKKVQAQFIEKVALLIINKNNTILNTHSLKGAKLNLISINVTGDYRALYSCEDGGILFREISTHSELY